MKGKERAKQKEQRRSARGHHGHLGQVPIPTTPLSQTQQPRGQGQLDKTNDTDTLQECAAIGKPHY